MLRTAVRASLRPSRVSQHARRAFVSTVLLSKTYEDKSVAELRTELRARGLSVTGAKATLISRIKQSDARAASEVQSSIHPESSRAAASTQTLSQTQARSALSTSAPRAELAPSPNPSPVSSASSAASSVKFDIKIPDASQEGPEQPVQVPFVPDLWDSSMKHTEEATSTTSFDYSTPRIMLAAGASTYPAGGPTYAMNPATDTLPSTEPPAPPRHYNGLLGDVLDDLGVPHNVLSIYPPGTSTESSHELAAKRSHSRPLDEEERRGAITLVGLLFSAWIVAGLTAPSSNKEKKKGKNGH